MSPNAVHTSPPSTEHASKTFFPKSKLLFSHSETLATLISEYPPNFSHHAKKYLFSTLLNSLSKYASTVEHCVHIRKYSSETLDTQLAWKGGQSLCPVEILQGPFDYQPDKGHKTKLWYLNFADANLFFAYAGSLFAQDEMQVCEMPVLASVRELLKHLTLENQLASPTTMHARHYATPYLIKNVPRHLHIDTAPSKSCPQGIYGNAFAATPLNELHKRCKVIHPPQNTNIIAMASLGYGKSYYTADQYSHLFLTALAAFSGARQETDDHTECIIHTGLWGCGAFGMSKSVSVLVQWMAASLAGVDKLKLHCVTKENNVQVRQILQEFSKKAHPIQQSYMSVSDFFAELDKKKAYKWGMSNGT